MATYPFTQWFRAALRPYLRERRISRNALATRLGVTNASIHRWDRGLSFPDERTQPALSREFQVEETRLAELVRLSRKQRLSEYGVDGADFRTLAAA